MGKRIKNITYFKQVIWDGINARTVNGKHPRWANPKNASYLKQGVELRFSKPEWDDWCDKHKEEIEGFYSRHETPSVDRGGSLHYEIDKIRILSHSKNARDGHKLWNDRFQRKIVGVKKDKSSTVNFNSLKEVEKLGMDPVYVCDALNGRKETAYGYVWFYLDKNKRNLELRNNQNDLGNFDLIFKEKTSKKKGQWKQIKVIAKSSNGQVLTFESLTATEKNGFNRKSVADHVKSGTPYQGYVWSKE